ncbi:Transmembrane protein 42 [Teratosphaeria destructans]|uniref:Transmembrane protein 42 n=1 Tax=Teratosphaeria destructans TaxID=418781 RepID=A0A9W7SHK6_9PEZI|nr:Transmembrane protein 42 [Teratosphaeria destructans]
MSASNSPQWLLYAIASGACAALNGVFAKLTTTSLTTSWATGISHLFGLSEPSRFVEVLVRVFFFLMNLAFNAVMWGLFTRALTLATSTVRVSVINTSANFMVTALLGAAIFSESLPALWWLGASLLVAGSVIIGRREEGKEVGAAGTAGVEPAVASGEQEGFRDEPDAPIAGVEGYRDSVELQRKPGLRRRSSGSEEDEDVSK